MADLTPWYASADVVVVPLHKGAGTRIKVLEAFAHRRPVVATPAAVAGLDVVDGRSVHLGTTAAELAAHTVRLLAAPDASRRTVDEADAVLSEHYLLDVVVPPATTAARSTPGGHVTADRPAPANGLDVHEVEDGLVVFDASTDRVHYLNPTATVVFSLCDGTRTTEEVADLVQSAWELDTAPLDDVVTCIAQLRDEGVLT